MIRRLVYSTLVVFVLILLGACDLNPSIRYDCDCSLNSDGSHVQLDDSRLNWDLGKPYYISDDLVFYLNTTIRRGSIGISATQIISGSLHVSDKSNMAMDIVNQKLYFAASEGIYRVSFDGGGLTNISPDQIGSISAPVLSADRNYLTTIRDGHILRLNLQNGEWIEELEITGVKYATYMSDTNEYYYYAPASINSTLALYRWQPGTSEPEMLMSQSANSRYTSWDISKDQRYFALMFRDPYDRESPYNNLQIYDRVDNEITTIGLCLSFAFAQSDSRLCYSRYIWGMADVNILNLETGVSSLIFDGYFRQNTYSYSIDRIAWDTDGEHIFYRGEYAVKERF